MGKSDWRVRVGFCEAKTFDLGSKEAWRINQAKIGGRTFWEEDTDAPRSLSRKNNNTDFIVVLRKIKNITYLLDHVKVLH